MKYFSWRPERLAQAYIEYEKIAERAAGILGGPPDSYCCSRATSQETLLPWKAQIVEGMTYGLLVLIRESEGVKPTG